MIGAVGFVLLGIFDDFCKVFHAVFQFHNALFGRFSGFGFHSNLMLQLGERTNFIIALCSNLQILDSCPLLESGTVLEFFIRGIYEPAGRVVFFRNNRFLLTFYFDAFPDTFFCVFLLLGATGTAGSAITKKMLSDTAYHITLFARHAGEQYSEDSRTAVINGDAENMGNLNPSGHGQGGNVYHEDGIAPTVTVNKGCGTRIFIDQSNHAPKLTENARCITARYTSGMVNHTAMNSAVMEVHPVLTPERMEKRQNGRRIGKQKSALQRFTIQNAELPRLLHT